MPVSCRLLLLLLHTVSHAKWNNGKIFPFCFKTGGACKCDHDVTHAVDQLTNELQLVASSKFEPTRER